MGGPFGAPVVIDHTECVGGTIERSMGRARMRKILHLRFPKIFAADLSKLGAEKIAEKRSDAVVINQNVMQGQRDGGLRHSGHGRFACRVGLGDAGIVLPGTGSKEFYTYLRSPDGSEHHLRTKWHRWWGFGAQARRTVPRGQYRRWVLHSGSHPGPQKTFDYQLAREWAKDQTKGRTCPETCRKRP